MHRVLHGRQYQPEQRELGPHDPISEPGDSCVDPCDHCTDGDMCGGAVAVPPAGGGAPSDLHGGHAGGVRCVLPRVPPGPLPLRGSHGQQRAHDDHLGAGANREAGRAEAHVLHSPRVRARACARLHAIPGVPRVRGVHAGLQALARGRGAPPPGLRERAAVQRGALHDDPAHERDHHHGAGERQGGGADAAVLPPVRGDQGVGRADVRGLLHHALGVRGLLVRLA
mmetsp:Transcript_57944/g.183932  ORF Transcript_57944/g.183932 Transcript_57944/m.183932 type:complete len:226 (+) Transcript_57944:648-1325(+)